MASIVTELRKEGKLDEAYTLAKDNLTAEPDSIWYKRDMAWVLHSFSKRSIEEGNIAKSYTCLEQIANMKFQNEPMICEQVLWHLGKCLFVINNDNKLKSDVVLKKRVVDLFSRFVFESPSDAYSFFAKMLHKAYKDSHEYIDAIDAIGFDFLRKEDYQQQKIESTGREIMAFAEQFHIHYAKKLLPTTDKYGGLHFDIEKVRAFIPRLDKIIQCYPEYQYPLYFKAKLTLAIGEKDSIVEMLVPFVKKKSSFFWVWQLLGDSTQDLSIRFSCYCKALTCIQFVKEEMLVSLRENTANIMAQNRYYSEAKTEIIIAIKTRQERWGRITKSLENIVAQEWYAPAKANTNNNNFYVQHISEAETLLYADVEQQHIVITSVNRAKQMVSFITAKKQKGFFKYEKLIKANIQIGDVFAVRFQSMSEKAPSRPLTVIKIKDTELSSKFVREFHGEVKIREDKKFGFVNDMYIHPAIVEKNNLSNRTLISGLALYEYNKAKEQWTWRVISVQTLKS